MNIFTCLSCRVVFSDADLQREHYKSDWHRYNLKRKVAELPPVTAENFHQRVLIQLKQETNEPENIQTYCELCSKQFKQENTYNNHLKSKKHIDLENKVEKQKQTADEKRKVKGLSETDVVTLKNAKNSAINDTDSLRIDNLVKTDTTNEPSEECIDDDDDDDDDESVESWSGDALGIEECFFCGHLSETLEDNLAHMSRIHCFFIPDVEYVCDLSGLMTYLGQKVGEGRICLWCNEHGRSFYSVKSVQQHMIDKGHTKMLHEGDAAFEYADFYDYRSSYPDYTPPDPNIASSSSNNTVNEGDDEEVVDISSILMEDYQLVLPSGATIGHRSLQRYYRQSLNPRRDVHINPAQRVIAQYRGLGWTGTGSGAAKRAKDVHYVQRIFSKQKLKMSMKNNKILQTHFRNQVIF